MTEFWRLAKYRQLECYGPVGAVGCSRHPGRDGILSKGNKTPYKSGVRNSFAHASCNVSPTPLAALSFSFHLNLDMEAW